MISEGLFRKIILFSKVNATGLLISNLFFLFRFIVETITPKDEKVKKETLILKSDGTTEKLEKDKKKSKVGRTLTSQEESILLPLIQGLLAANEANNQSKHENTPFREKESTSNASNNKAEPQNHSDEKGMRI